MDSYVNWLCCIPCGGEVLHFCVLDVSHETPNVTPCRTSPPMPDFAYASRAKRLMNTMSHLTAAGCSCLVVKAVGTNSVLVACLIVITQICVCMHHCLHVSCLRLSCLIGITMLVRDVHAMLCHVMDYYYVILGPTPTASATPPCPASLLLLLR